MVSTLHFRSCQALVLCSWARHFTLTVPLSTQEYKIMGIGKLSGKPDEMLWGYL